VDGALRTRYVETFAGLVRIRDSGGHQRTVVIVPDGPNIIEHYSDLFERLAESHRVVCFDMPGFGFSTPSARYDHSLDAGARAVLAVLDALRIDRATLAFNCANGFYALRLAQIAPNRVTRLVLSQTPSLSSMQDWVRRVIPSVIRMPAVGQVSAWLFRRRAASGWYRAALPRTTAVQPFEEPALRALSRGACFCLAGVVQGLAREQWSEFTGIATACTMIWGACDRSHAPTDCRTLLERVPHAEIVRFEDCGHFPDLEQPSRFAEILTR
jgi:pimeloyl-ACP methyl ester carboxylesterase